MAGRVNQATGIGVASCGTLAILDCYGLLAPRH